jgi:hypothetical protein
MNRTCLILTACFDVLPNALSIKDMMALGFDSVLSNVVTYTAYGSLYDIARQINVPSALKHEIGLTSRVRHLDSKRGIDNIRDRPSASCESICQGNDENKIGLAPYDVSYKLNMLL